MTYIVYALCICLFVLIDQIAKKAVISGIGLGQSILLIRDFFYLTHVHNYGAGFSILQNATVFLIVLSAGACLALGWMLYKTDRKDLVSIFSYLLIISGAIGNLIDRVRFSYVIDFLDFKIFGYDYPVFNLADSFITVGCFLLIIKTIWESRHA